MKLSIREQQIMSEAAVLLPKTRREQALMKGAEYTAQTVEEIALGMSPRPDAEDDGVVDGDEGDK